MKKKILSAVLAFTAMTGLLAGCGGADMTEIGRAHV